MTFIQIPWFLSVPVVVIAAMLIFRGSLGAPISSASHEFKAGRFFSWKAKRPSGPTQVLAQIVREIAQAPEGEQFDGRRLVIRDAQGRPRLLASTVASGEPFLALIDEGGETPVLPGCRPSRGPEWNRCAYVRKKGRAWGNGLVHWCGERWHRNRGDTR
jgi:hypothetical protein